MTDVQNTPVSPARAELEAERAFLLTSLADLDAERDAGAIDEATYVRLSDDYTARAAAVIRELDVIDEPVVVADAPRWRTPVAIGAIVVFLGLSALVLWNALADRKAGQTVTGGPATTASPTQQRDLLEADVARDPTNPAAQRALARLFLQQQQYADALRAFDRAAALDPKDAESRAYAGWVTYLAGLPERALVRIDTAIAADPQYADAHFFRGMVLFRGLNDAAGAIPEFEQFLALAPQSPMAEQVRSALSSARQAAAAAPATVAPSTPPK